MSRRVSSRKILSSLEKELGFKIIIKSRKPKLVYSRAVFYRLCRELTKDSYEKIAKLANTTHCNILHSEVNVFPYLKRDDKNIYDAYLRVKYNFTKESDTPINELLDSLINSRDEMRKEINDLKEINELKELILNK